MSFGCLILGLLICFETMLLCTVGDCSESFNLHWNTSNPIFRVDNTDNVIPMNQGNTQFDYDQVNIICPIYEPGTQDTEKYIIYNVSKEEYEACHISNLNPEIMAVCNKPHKLIYYSINFKPFTPQPGVALKFPPGQDYYFISTSSKDDLHGRIGGLCASNNMKIIIRVCCRPEDTHNQSVRHNAVPTNSSSSMTTNLEKSPEYSHQPNEVDKNKQLTQHGRSSSSPLYSISPKHKLLAIIIISLVSFLIVQ